MAKFNAYVTSLGLKNSAGAALTSDNMIEELRQELVTSAEAYMAAGNSIPNLGEVMSWAAGNYGSSAGSYTNDFIAVDNSAAKVLSIDMSRYLVFLATQATLKPAPAFDEAGLTITGGTAESALFGTSAQAYSNFTEYSWDNNDTAGDGSGLDDTGLTWAQYSALSTTLVVKQANLINPMHFIGTSTGTRAPYWYIRHGTRDRDTAPLVSLNLARALKADSAVKDLNYRLAWGQPHGEGYDVPEAMTWITKILTDAKAKGI
ncbi:hypothetical protein [Xylophilus sp.]|uniref:hypothetical protein n=1 Tax=Xylophilus sp. TaxID=2653893 RepID=UPI0013BDCADC|nr:hypothetical protein [Xylophilus sp.]KAF1043340.1 MAG: hypothetical protein GAK38_03990 [Xylophilus sp.]